MVKLDWKGRLIIIVDRFDCQLSDVVNYIRDPAEVEQHEA